MKNALMVLVISVLSGCGGGGSNPRPSPLPPPPPPPISVSVSPTEATVQVGATQQFTATVANTTNTAVTWQVNGQTGGNSSVGTISDSGLYTAPAAVPNPSTVTVTAISQADSSKSASATVTINPFSNATLNGQYALSFAGVGGVGVGRISLAGTFRADGNGNILEGIEDLNQGLPAQVFPNLPFTGTYSVGPDGRGNATITSSRGTSTFRFVAGLNQVAKIIEFDGSAVGRGSIEKQDTSAFLNSAFNGGYAFRFSGVGFETFGAFGRFTANGAGQISAGVLDDIDAGIVHNVSFTGTYNVASNGRGTAALTRTSDPAPGQFHPFAFYMVSASRAVLVSLGSPQFVGAAEKQQADLFSNLSLSGPYTFLLTGTNASGRPAASAGLFLSNGQGAISGGALDQNEAGSLSENVSFTGTYNVSSNGRGTVSLTSAIRTSTFAFYLISSRRAFFIETDGFAAGGEIDSQQGGPYTNASFSGNYGFVLHGVATSPSVIVAIAGQINSDGAGTITGIEDVNTGGTLTSGASLTGSYSIAANGRGVATVTVGGSVSNLRFYLISPSVAFFIEMDATAVLAGAAEKQF